MKKVLILIAILAVAGVGSWVYFGWPVQVSAPQPAVNPPSQTSPPATPPAPPAIDTNDNLDDALKDLDAVK